MQPPSFWNSLQQELFNCSLQQNLQLEEEKGKRKPSYFLFWNFGAFYYNPKFYCRYFSENKLPRLDKRHSCCSADAGHQPSLLKSPQEWLIKFPFSAPSRNHSSPFASRQARSENPHRQNDWLWQIPHLEVSKSTGTSSHSLRHQSGWELSKN